MPLGQCVIRRWAGTVPEATASATSRRHVRDIYPGVDLVTPHLPLTNRREFWLPATGDATGYHVSSRGRVRSPRKILKTPLNTNGYPCVTIRHRRTYVHKLVLETWVCPMPSGKEALHGNDIRQDNRLINLRWGTRSENLRDLVRNGKHFWASKTRCPAGHRYSPENTIQHKTGRQCRTCHRVIARESRWRRKAARQSPPDRPESPPNPQKATKPAPDGGGYTGQGVQGLTEARP
jgi:hypothetical protein